MTLDVNEKLNDSGKLVIEVTASHIACKYTIRPTNDGFVFYEITSDSPMSEKLKGRYLTAHSALKHLSKYITAQPKSKGLKRKEWREKFRDAAATKSDDQGELQQGSAD